MIRRGPLLMAVACAAIAISVSVAEFRPNEKAVLLVQDEVYEAVIRNTFMPTPGQSNATQLVFADALVTYREPGLGLESCEKIARQRLLLMAETSRFGLSGSLIDNVTQFLFRQADGSLKPDTIKDFLEKSCTEGSLSTTFHTDLPRTFIDRNSVEFDNIPRGGPKDFEQKFPGANGMISLSRVGFDSTLHEAMVSSSFVCGMLCGESRRYILRKTQGKWIVVQTLRVAIY
jgi:hypothetical protein